MKKIFIPIIAIFALTVSTNAQHQKGKSGNHRQHQKGMMAEELNFTEAQKTQAKTINADYRKQMQELDKNESITVKTMRDRKSAIQKEKKTRMEELLTPDQQTKKKTMISEQKAKKEAGQAKRMDKMKTNLSLSDDQVNKLKSVRATTQTKAEKIKIDESLSREQKKEQLMALKADAKKQHEKTFTAEQQKKLAEQKQTRGEKIRSKK